MELIREIEQSTAHSIPYAWFEENALLLQEGLYPRINYLKAVEQRYLKGE
ncbi:Penicillin-binding protein-related factor A, putative recombinase [gut metagenome]|uniref:Penicillin-binding protein-related factor A, putative recombinase n=1 Tax=gut metagenome TaxID=749906 RepID=J9G1Z6_9ZZZZ